jgi:peptidoglycan-associated lipoprotein
MKIKNVLGLALIVVTSFVFVNCANQNKKTALRPVHFDYDQSYIRKDMVPVMDGNVAYLKGTDRHFSTKAFRYGGNGDNVVVEGHCDNRGTNEYNYALGARRAETTKSYLVSHGISKSRVKTVSFGEDRPLCRGSNESCWYKNRRAAFKTR